MIDSKGLGVGILTTDPAGRGMLVRADGTSEPQRWMDSTRERSAAGILFRLTGLRGWPAWVLPDVTTLDLPGLVKARAFRPGGTVGQISDVYSGSLDEVMRGAAAACGSRRGGGARPVRHRGAGTPAGLTPG